jgi:hypothetical protein
MLDWLTLHMLLLLLLARYMCCVIIFLLSVRAAVHEKLQQVLVAARCPLLWGALRG